MSPIETEHFGKTNKYFLARRKKKVSLEKKISKNYCSGGKHKIRGTKGGKLGDYW